MTNIFSSKKFQEYICKCCDYNTSRKSQYDRHLMTLKHKIRTNTNFDEDKKFQKVPDDNKEYICHCGKQFKHASSLWNHKKKCEPDNQESTSVMVDIGKEYILKMLLKNQDIMEGVLLKNQDVMEKMMDIIPAMGNHTNSNNTTNSHNTQNFNIQMFLNDHCKNAMNLTDFIDTLPITAETYDNTVENGLTKTITNMITNGLNQLDILERPIHCTDASRKTLYVKQDNEWEKDNEMVKILLSIRRLASHQRILINKWKDVHDDWNTNDRMQTRFTSLICNSINDIENDEKETNKIKQLNTQYINLIISPFNFISQFQSVRIITAQQSTQQ